MNVGRGYVMNVGRGYVIHNHHSLSRSVGDEGRHRAARAAKNDKYEVCRLGVGPIQLACFAPKSPNPTALWGHRLPVRALALSARGWIIWRERATQEGSPHTISIK